MFRKLDICSLLWGFDPIINSMKKIFTGFILLLLFSLSARADTIFFKNNTRLDIKKTWEEDGHIKCEMFGLVASYPKKEVDRVEKGPLENQAAQSSAGNEKDAAGPLSGQQQKAVKPSPESRSPQIQKSALDLHIRAVELGRQEAWREAIEKERQAYKLEPQQEMIQKTLCSLYNGYALELKNKGERPEAVRILNLALTYDPHHLQVKKNMAVVHVDMAYEAFAGSNYTKSRTLLEKASRFDKNNPHIYVLSAKIAYNSDNYAKAQKDLSKALGLDPGLAEARALLKKLKKDIKLEDGFETKETGNFKIKFAGTQNQDLADDVARVLQDAYQQVGRDFNLFPDAEIPVIIYPRSGMEQLDYFPDWAAGVYDGKIRFGEDLWKHKFYMKAVLYHEYTHVLVYISGGRNVPLWLNEGLAEYEARQFKRPSMRSFRKKLLFKAAQKKALFRLDQLTGVNLSIMSRISPRMITLLYTQSESFMTFLIERYSISDMMNILVRLSKGTPVRKAVPEVLGENLAVIEQEWRSQFE
jgi:tetratricopeptide (TPR) repeat protein